MIQRDVYINKILPFIDTELIKIITGVRRSGKSVFLQLIQEELLHHSVERTQIISINFEEYENQKYRDDEFFYSHMKTVIEATSQKKYLFFDEVQELHNWEKCINALNVKFNVDIYVTGSNAKILSSELATYIAGRYIEIKMYPFSFKEFVSIQSKNSVDKIDLFNTYLELGGMPFLINLNYVKQPSLEYLQTLYNTIVIKDIVKRNHIRDVDLLDRIIKYLFDTIGNPVSANSISKYFKSENRKVTVDTVLNYLFAIESSYLMSRVKTEDLKGKKILKTYDKFYVVDHGLRHALLNSNISDIQCVLENIVYVELLRRGYRISVGRFNNREIDFACTKNGEKLYIQVSYLLASKETIEREFGNLLAIKDNCSKMVLSMDSIDLSQRGIIHKNIIDFLLED